MFARKLLAFSAASKVDFATARQGVLREVRFRFWVEIEDGTVQWLWGHSRLSRALYAEENDTNCSVRREMGSSATDSKLRLCWWYVLLELTVSL